MLRNHRDCVLPPAVTMARHKYLDQYEYWRPAGRTAQRIDELDWDHLLNLRDWLNTNAVKLYDDYHGTHDSPYSHRARSLLWIKNMPLYISLEHEIKERQKIKPVIPQPDVDLVVVDKVTGEKRHYQQVYPLDNDPNF